MMRDVIKAGLKSIRRNRFVLQLNLHAIVQVDINEDTAAMLTNHDLLALANLALALWRNNVEAATAGIAQYRYNGETIRIRATDTLVCA